MKDFLTPLFPYRKASQITIGHLTFGFSGQKAGFSVRRILEDPEDAFQDIASLYKSQREGLKPLTGGSLLGIYSRNE
jgi:hypothetical protein